LATAFGPSWFVRVVVEETFVSSSIEGLTTKTRRAKSEDPRDSQKKDGCLRFLFSGFSLRFLSLTGRRHRAMVEVSCLFHTGPPMDFVLQPWQFCLVILAGWVNRQQQEFVEYIRAENRVLKEKLGGKRILLNDDQRRLLAVKGKLLGRKRLEEVGTLFTPDTILRWHRQLVAQKWDHSDRRSSGRPRTGQAIVDLILRFARENPTWGYDRIQGALANVGYHISDRTVGNVLKQHGIEPAPERKRQTSWSTFLMAHWDVLAAIDFTTVEVWTKGGLVTFYLLFAMELESRRRRKQTPIFLNGAARYDAASRVGSRMRVADQSRPKARGACVADVTTRPENGTVTPVRLEREEKEEREDDTVSGSSSSIRHSEDLKNRRALSMPWNHRRPTLRACSRIPAAPPATRRNIRPKSRVPSSHWDGSMSNRVRMSADVAQQERRLEEFDSRSPSTPTKAELEKLAQLHRKPKDVWQAADAKELTRRDSSWRSRTALDQGTSSTFSPTAQDQGLRHQSVEGETRHELNVHSRFSGPPRSGAPTLPAARKLAGRVLVERDANACRYGL
jgi:transposase